MNPWVALTGGALLLYFGAEWFVGGASALALAFRVPQILVGLTVVAYGTSAPEIIVGVHAAHAGHGGVALGNVVGSNIANVGLILGAALLVRAARVDGALRSRELPVLMVSTALVPLALLDGVVSRVEGAAMLALAVLYTGWMVRSSRSASAVAAAEAGAVAAEEASDAAGAPSPEGPRKAALTAAAGLGVLLIGGNLFVDAAVLVARSLGMSERLVGLTIVAVGTSLPELVTSVIAARRGHSDIAIGNVVGSNIFNVLLCLGAASAVAPVRASLGSIAVDLVALGGMTALMAWFLRREQTLSKAEGAVALVGYAAFTVIAIARG